MARVTVVDDPEQLADAAALRVATLIEAAVTARESAAICLTGGRTPERLYQLLADDTRPWRSRIDWARVHVFWGDERQVPPDHPDSNFGMAYRTLLSRVPVPPDHIHRIHGERADAHDAAREYEAELRAVRLEADTTYDKDSVPDVRSVRLQPDPLFDVMLLGVGEDAHIASIFPGSPLLADLAGREVPPYGAGGLDGLPERAAAVWIDHLDAWRITLTPSSLLDSHAILVMASGTRKADAVRAALVGPDDASRYPAQLVRGAEWLIDRAAARSLDAPPGR